MRTLPIIVPLLLVASARVDGAAIPEAARRYFGRGIAAVKMAKSPADYEAAIPEFEKAKALAPKWAELHYNLALVQEQANRYGDAAAILKRYLRLAPDCDDAMAVRSLLNKLEYKTERTRGERDILDSVVGTWIGIGGNGKPQFFIFSENEGRLCVRYETTSILGTSRDRFGWHNAPVSRQGRRITFTAQFRNDCPKGRIYTIVVRDAHFLELLDAETMKGTLNTHAGGTYFFRKAMKGAKHSLWRMDGDRLSKLLLQGREGKHPPGLGTTP